MEILGTILLLVIFIGAIAARGAAILHYFAAVQEETEDHPPTQR